jgi:hypothetical protein
MQMDRVGEEEDERLVRIERLFVKKFSEKFEFTERGTVRTTPLPPHA